MEKGENAGHQHFLLFPQCFLAIPKRIYVPIGGYLDFSHLTELKNIYVTEIYLKKQYKSSIIKNHKIRKKNNFAGKKKKTFSENQVTNDT